MVLSNKHIYGQPVIGPNVMKDEPPQTNDKYGGSVIDDGCKCHSGVCVCGQILKNLKMEQKTLLMDLL